APRDPQQPIINARDFRKLLRESMFITAGSMGVYGLSMRRYGIGMQAGTNTFMAFTLAKLLHALSCRSEDTTVLDRNRPANPHMVTALGGTLALQVLAATVPQLRSLLRSSPLAIADLPLIIAGASIPFLVNESAKRLVNQSRKNGG
ncbi:MAG: family P-type ATPase, partial [Proteobacteria bacterium]|nr:family P-type ATPase [Pseudomonadota bacterium]